MSPGVGKLPCNCNGVQRSPHQHLHHTSAPRLYDGDGLGVRERQVEGSLAKLAGEGLKSSRVSRSRLRYWGTKRGRPKSHPCKVQRGAGPLSVCTCVCVCVCV